MSEPSENGILEEFRIEFSAFWQRMPNKGMFLVLLTAWVALFHWAGNAAMGYVRTQSIFGWLYAAYAAGGGLMESDQAICVFMPVVIAGLLWWKRNELLALDLRCWWPGLALVLAGLLLHALGFLIQQPMLSAMAFFAGIYGLSGLVWGPQWIRATFFPFFLFGFMVPLGSIALPVTFRLRMLASQLVEIICGLMTLDIIRDGAALKDPTGRFQYEVAAACSGIRSVMAVLVFGVIYAWMVFPQWWKRGVILASVLPLAVIGNVLRLLAIVLAANFWGQEAGNYVHEGGPGGIISLLPYIPAFMGLLWLGQWLQGIKPAAPAGQGGTSK
jgi:exosortase